MVLCSEGTWTFRKSYWG